jgi:sugar phosphate isomerase/epimerase
MQISRRTFIGSLAAASSAACVAANSSSLGDESPGNDTKPKTNFQLACMTLPYSQFPLERALTGIKSAGFDYVAWGTTHKEEGGKQTPVLAADASVATAKDLGKRCRDLGLEPVLMFSTVYPEHKDGLALLTQRFKQAEGAGVAQVLTFGHTEGGNERVWIERFKRLGPIARDYGVLLVVKQHGGDTGTGEACAKIVREVNDPGVMVNYDAGNVMDYLDVDPIADIEKCADVVRSFCMKDHRNWPKDEDCAPGLGQIDHYRLLAPFAHTGLKLPLCFENISEPLVPRPTAPESIDRLARRSREFIETVIAGLHVS